MKEKKQKERMIQMLNILMLKIFNLEESMVQKLQQHQILQEKLKKNYNVLQKFLHHLFQKER
eukprot:CAMPEP_0174826318 /NCGR_PEP_ID=MMETSP1107-20130205/43830_1 /TAXON_ID=36770 /ORGANISM="Paraphysomonas vestita, Strain GFlagA" /LENGTH=61 /DNA_ID=CAMNT_0016059191 /DNA_START=1518 /DNA_END=1700 /DNA_ORIENTATION=-